MFDESKLQNVHTEKSNAIDDGGFVISDGEVIDEESDDDDI